MSEMDEQQGNKKRRNRSEDLPQNFPDPSTMTDADAHLFFPQQEQASPEPISESEESPAAFVSLDTSALKAEAEAEAVWEDEAPGTPANDIFAEEVTPESAAPTLPPPVSDVPPVRPVLPPPVSDVPPVRESVAPSVPVDTSSPAPLVSEAPTSESLAPAPESTTPIQPDLIVPEGTTAATNDAQATEAQTASTSAQTQAKDAPATSSTSPQTQAKDAPASTSSESLIETYTVQRGDTLATISTRFKTTVADLANLNGISNTSKVSAGQVLKLPPQVKAVTSTSPQTQAKDAPAASTTAPQTQSKDAPAASTTASQTQRKDAPASTTAPQAQSKDAPAASTTSPQAQSKDAPPASTTAPQTQSKDAPASTTAPQTQAKDAPAASNIASQTQAKDAPATSTTTPQTQSKDAPASTTAPQTQAKDAPAASNIASQTQAKDAPATSTTTPQTQSKDAQPASTTTPQTQAKDAPASSTTTPQTQAKDVPATSTTTPQAQSKDTKPASTTAPQAQSKDVPATAPTSPQMSSKDAKPAASTTAPQTQSKDAPAASTTASQTQSKDAPAASTTSPQTQSKDAPASTTTQTQSKDAQPASTTASQTQSKDAPASTTAPQAQSKDAEVSDLTSDSPAIEETLGQAEPVLANAAETVGELTTEETLSDTGEVIADDPTSLEAPVTDEAIPAETAITDSPVVADETIPAETPISDIPAPVTDEAIPAEAPVTDTPAPLVDEPVLTPISEAFPTTTSESRPIPQPVEAVAVEATTAQKTERPLSPLIATETLSTTGERAPIFWRWGDMLWMVSAFVAIFLLQAQGFQAPDTLRTIFSLITLAVLTLASLGFSAWAVLTYVERRRARRLEGEAMRIFFMAQCGLWLAVMISTIVGLSLVNNQAPARVMVYVISSLALIWWAAKLVLRVLQRHLLRSYDIITNSALFVASFFALAFPIIAAGIMHANNLSRGYIFKVGEAYGSTNIIALSMSIVATLIFFVVVIPEQMRYADSTNRFKRVMEFIGNFLAGNTLEVSGLAVGVAIAVKDNVGLGLASLLLTAVGLIVVPYGILDKIRSAREKTGYEEAFQVVLILMSISITLVSLLNFGFAIAAQSSTNAIISLIAGGLAIISTSIEIVELLITRGEGSIWKRGSNLIANILLILATVMAILGAASNFNQSLNNGSIAYASIALSLFFLAFIIKFLVEADLLGKVVDILIWLRDRITGRATVAPVVADAAQEGIAPTGD